MNDRPAIPFEDVLDRLPEPNRSEVLQAYHDSLEHYRGIREIREALERTQTETAAAMGITPAALSKLERKADLYVGTLRKVIRSLGGEVEVIVRLPDRDPIRLAVGGD